MKIFYCAYIACFLYLFIYWQIQVNSRTWLLWTVQQLTRVCRSLWCVDLGRHVQPVLARLHVFLHNYQCCPIHLQITTLCYNVKTLIVPHLESFGEMPRSGMGCLGQCKECLTCAVWQPGRVISGVICLLWPAGCQTGGILRLVTCPGPCGARLMVVLGSLPTRAGWPQVGDFSDLFLPGCMALQTKLGRGTVSPQTPSLNHMALGRRSYHLQLAPCPGCVAYMLLWYLVFFSCVCVLYAFWILALCWISSW